MNQKVSLPARPISYKMFKIYLGVLLILIVFMLVNRQKNKQSLYSINLETHDLLHSLIKTKYFRIFRANLNKECDLYTQSKICKSKSCSVCRCDQKDIPTNWIKTDKVKKQQNPDIDVWEKQRQAQDLKWIWHVEDEENDEGQYFDLDVNIESFTNYNGSTIWRMIYQQNCFNGSREHKYEQKMCKEQEVFYKVISGLHTSISSHLARFYKNISSKEAQIWADLKGSDQFYFNQKMYQKRVLNHPDRVNNLLFVYQIFLRAIKEVSPHIIKNYTMTSDSFIDDSRSVELLQNLSKLLQNYSFKPFDAELNIFFYPQNPKVKLYQKYIHNISKIMDCVECQKCRLFGKMQTYGIGTALKILLGYNKFYKRNQIVALYNAWNKISMSVEFYYKTAGAPQQGWQYDVFWLRLFAIVAGAFILFIYLTQQINIQQRIKKLFKNVVIPGESEKKKEMLMHLKKED